MRAQHHSGGQVVDVLAALASLGSMSIIVVTQNEDP